MKQYLLILTSVLLFAACRKDGVADPDFSVTVDKTTFNAGDTVDFSFTGNPDFLTFYADTAGCQYAFRNRAKAPGKPVLNFTSYAQKIGTQTPSLQLLASTNFTGTYTPAGIAAATWTDLSGRAVFSSGTDNTPSGTIDLSDVASADKNIYFAFKKHDDSSATLKPWAWTIRSFAINLNASDNNRVYPITTLSTAGWLGIDVRNASYKWSVAAAALTIDGGTVNTPENEDWVITNPLNLYTVKPDAGISLKTIDSRISSYRSVYTRPGTYTATFVASNQTAKDIAEVVKSVTITIR